MFTYAARNDMLNAIINWYFSAHTDYPGTTGAHEVVGGSYARVLATMGAAASGVRTLTVSADLNIPASTTVKWIGVWDFPAGSPTATFLAAMPLGGVPLEFYVDPSTDTFYVPSHGYNNGDQVVVYGVGSVPGGLTAGVIYYVVNKATDTFQLSATMGGSVIDVTSHNAADSLVSKIVPESFVGVGVCRVNSGSTFALNN